MCYSRVGELRQHKESIDQSENIGNENQLKTVVDTSLDLEKSPNISSMDHPPSLVPPPIYPTLPKNKPIMYPGNGAMTRHQIISMFSTYSDSDRER